MADLPPISFKFLIRNTTILVLSGLLVLVVSALVFAGFSWRRAISDVSVIESERESLIQRLQAAEAELETFRTTDQVVRNEMLVADMAKIRETFRESIRTYEDIIDLRHRGVDVAGLEKDYASILNQLSRADYDSAQDVITDLNSKVSTEEQKLAAAAAAVAAQAAAQQAAAAEAVGETATDGVAPTSAIPASGTYTRQAVKTDVGTFTVSIVAGDLSSTRVIVDTASDSDCADNCPVLSLGEYVGRNGAFAGINGTYFCPASYPSCAGKTNSYDLLVMNKNKTYFNSDNNVYSNNPAVIFSGGSVRFVTRALEWGRDTGVDAVISNYPLLVFNSQVVFGGDSDPKSGVKGGRSFVSNRGSTAYIGVVHSATIAESARVLHAMGMDNAMNLDNGGSTALWAAGGYKAGPGRNLPNALLFLPR